MARESWVDSTNDSGSEFPIQNLPYGIFDSGDGDRIGVAIGDQILDLQACASRGLLEALSPEIVDACGAEVLNQLMSLGPSSWSALRRQLIAMLKADDDDRGMQQRVEPFLVPMCDVTMRLPAQIGDYTDFYASIHHATRVGRLFRPDSPLLPNYKYVPIGYHGRASSIVVSGTAIRRPCGQAKQSASELSFGPTQSLDYELEMGIFIGPGNPHGSPVSIDEAERHIFGLCLLNDWSARDIQSWESQPLGPFLAKSFATTISPWVVTMEALAPYRVPASERPEGDPKPLPYLQSSTSTPDGIDLCVEVYLRSRLMRELRLSPMFLSKANLRDTYWTVAQLLTHHTSNGCNLRPGDLLATGTISGPNEGSEGCLLEKKLNPNLIQLPSGELRTFLEDGDDVCFRGYAQRQGLPKIGFGECSGTILGE